MTPFNIYIMIRILEKPGFLNRLVNKQFEIIGQPDIKIEDIEKGITIKDGKKEKIVDWWKMYSFESNEQYQKWRDWAIKELSRMDGTERQLNTDITFIDLVYGLPVKIKKEGQTTLF
jgi:hypothetical protein